MKRQRVLGGLIGLCAAAAFVGAFVMSGCGGKRPAGVADVLDLAPADTTVVLVVDFKKLIEEGDSAKDVVLRDEDIVYIASDLHSVLVQGQVANPGYIAYVPGATYQYYIDKAGGYSELAVEGDTRIIKKGSLEWVEPEKTVIESGDQIWVPKEPRKTFAYYFAIMRDASQIAAAIVSITYLIVAIRTLSK